MGVFNNFPYANFHELNADWIIEQVRKVMDDWEEYKTDMDLWKLGVDDQLAEFQAWFDNLDVQDEVRTVMNELILSGEFIEITSPQIVSATESWLAAHITPTTPAVDDTLSISGAAADAKVTGDRITDLKEDLFDLQNEYYIFKLIDNSYVETDGHIVTPYTGWSRTDYIDCGNYKSMTLQRSAGIASRYNCFYDANKTFISSFSDGALDELKTIEIPSNAKYVMLSNATNYIKALQLKFYPAESETIAKTAVIVSEISEENSIIKSPTSAGVTLYPTNGYIRNSDGAFIEHNSYQCYYFTMSDTSNVWFNNPYGWHQIAVYNGDAFDTSNLITIKTSSQGTLPTYNNPLSIEQGMTVVICVSINSGFALYVGTGIYSAKVTEKPHIIVRPKYATQFSVEVLDQETGEYITYWFFHPTFTDQMTHGGQTIDVVTYDVWFNNNINNADGELIFQGNTNFIHALSETGHTGHVGAGHGCTVMDCCQFFADGKPFDPATLATPIECTEFRFIIKAKHYKIDDSITISSVHAMPVLDGNGDPVVTSEWVFDGTWTVNNRIEMQNHLEIKQDNLSFRQCHAGMLCGFYPDIDNVMLTGRKGLYWNSTNGTICTDRSNSGVTFLSGGNTSLIADSATIFGSEYVARQDFWQYDPTMYGNDNVLAWMPPNSDNRLKMYLMPCVCTESTALINEGKEVNVFNIGDSIDVKMVRTIEIASN